MKIKPVYLPALKNNKYAALTLFPFIIFFSSKEETSFITICHERVHVNQIRQIGFFSFYISYLLYFLAGLIHYKHWSRAYFNIPFEIEAFSREYEPLMNDEAEEFGLETY